jgi:protein SCO1/2
VSRPRRVAIAALAVLIGLTTVSCGDDGTASGSDPARSDIQGLVRDQPLDVGDVTLPDAGTGQPAGVVPPPGQLQIVYFGYTSCPDVCPTTMSDVQRALEQLDPEDAARVEVVFITVDPQRDTAQLLDDYLGYFFERQRALRTEDPTELAAAQDAFLASSSIDPTGPDTYEVSHSAVTYVVGTDGKVLVEWAFGTSSDTIAHDLQILTGRAASEPTAPDASA